MLKFDMFKNKKKYKSFFCYHRLSWFHTCLLYDNNANYGKMNLSLCNEILTPFLMIWMFFVRFIFSFVTTISLHQLFAWRSTSKSHFSLGNTTIPHFVVIDHIAIHRDIARITSILLNINFCIWKNMRLIRRRRTVKIRRWWVTKKQKNWIFKTSFSKNIFQKYFLFFQLF